jgi:uncharacterized protein YbjT (DUF2867 family)
MSAMSGKVLTVFGGTGFLGRHVVRRALADGWDVRVAVRRPRSDRFAGDSPQPTQLVADITDTDAVETAVSGAAGVVNAVALYTENRRESFEATHVTGAGNVAMAAKRAAARLVHLSGIGIDSESASAYVRARARGEEQVRAAHPDSVILRPSALFGPGDALLSAVIPMVEWLPVIPLFGRGDSRVQPVHVDDVSRAVAAALVRDDVKGMTIELGGPDVYTYRELLEGIAGRLGRRRWFKPVPYRMWNLLAALAYPLPGPPITRDQIELVRRDNVVTAEITFESLGIDFESLRHVLDCVGPDPRSGFPTVGQ